MRHDVAGSVYGHGFAVRDKSLVVTAGHAVDVADGLISIGARGRIRGASLDRSSEVVERFRVRVQPLSAVTGASEPSDGLRVVITAAVVERQGVDELVDALAEQVGVRVANGDVRSPTMGDQLRPVGDLLDQRVAEGIRRLGDLDSEHEVLPLERPERGIQVLVRRDARQHPCPECSADDRGAVRHVARRGIERVQARF